MAADISSSLASWSTTESSNQPQGSTTISSNLDDNLRMIQAVVAGVSNGTQPLVTPSLGTATATKINKVTITQPASGSTLSIADGKTLTASNSVALAGTDGSTLDIGTGGTLGTAAYTNSTAYELYGSIAGHAALRNVHGLNITAAKTLGVTNSITLSGTDGTTMTLPSTNATIARTDAANTFSGTQTFSSTINGSINGNAATVTTNANLTGEVTSVGNSAQLDNNSVINKILSGFASLPGTITSSDSIITAIQKLDANANQLRANAQAFAAAQG